MDDSMGVAALLITGHFAAKTPGEIENSPSPERMARVCHEFLKLPLRELVIVTGQNRELLTPHLPQSSPSLPIHVLWNARWKTGLKSGLKLGLNSFTTNPESVMLWTEDQPVRTSEELKAILDEYAQHEWARIAVPVQDGLRTYPPLFAMSLRNEITGPSVRGDGLRQLYRNFPQQLVEVHLPDAPGAHLPPASPLSTEVEI